jgi:hypothetical protein
MIACVMQRNTKASSTDINNRIAMKKILVVPPALARE